MYLYDTQFADEDNYFAEINNGSKKIILQITPEGAVYLFKDLTK